MRTAVLVSQLKNGRRVDLDKGMALVLGTELPRFIRLPDCQTGLVPSLVLGRSRRRSQTEVWAR